MIAATTVRKKKENSPSPLSVMSERKSPRRIYSVESTVERSKALSGASDVDGFEESGWVVLGAAAPMRPRIASGGGSQFLFAAATAIRPATKEFPSKEPATTRHIRVAAAMPNQGPRSLVMAVLGLSVSHYQFNDSGNVRHTTATLSVVGMMSQGSSM